MEVTIERLPIFEGAVLVVQADVNSEGCILEKVEMVFPRGRVDITDLLSDREEESIRQEVFDQDRHCLEEAKNFSAASTHSVDGGRL